MSAATDIDDVQLSRRVTWLCRLLGVGGLALLAVTWKLWTPQDVFPRVPLFAWAPPRWWDWASLAGLTAGLVGLCLPIRYRRIAAAAVAGGFTLQFLADQHRLQPWAWEFFILAVVIALADDRLVFRGWMALVISIYFWSAWSKCDAAFLEQFTRLIFAVLSRPSEALGVKWLPPMNRGVGELSRVLASAAPAVEFGIVLMLMSVRTRGLGVLLATAMHLYLITLLGPWGLGHQPGVLVWNAFFIVRNAILYRRSPITFRDAIPLLKPAFAAVDRTIPHRIAKLLFIVVMLWPAVEPWGYCDAWLGWAVYVPRFQQVEIWTDEATKNRLPSEISKYLEMRHGSSQSRRMNLLLISRMSLDRLGVPAYPNHRLAVGAAIGLQTRYGISAMDLVLLERHGRQNNFPEYNRWSGYPKSVRTYTTPAEIEAYARTFRVNALPESVLRRQAILR